MVTTKPENKEIEKMIRKSFKGQDAFILKSVQNVNHNPHPYMIGPAHIAYASEHYGGMLGMETLDKVKCAHPGGCNLSYDQHTSDTVAFLQLQRNITKDEADVIVKKLIKDIPEGIFDGIVFVETEEKFRIN